MIRHVSPSRKRKKKEKALALLIKHGFVHSSALMLSNQIPLYYYERFRNLIVSGVLKPLTPLPDYYDMLRAINFKSPLQERRFGEALTRLIGEGYLGYDILTGEFYVNKFKNRMVVEYAREG